MEGSIVSLAVSRFPDRSIPLIDHPITRSPDSHLSRKLSASSPILCTMSLRRELGFFDATMVVVGGIIGAGIFINPAIVAARLPSGALVIAAWVVGGAIALAGAFVFAELAAALPQAGGEYAYLRDAYHPLVGFLFGWASLFLIQGGGIAAVAITFAQYLLRLTGRAGTSPTPIAIAALALLALVNVLGVKPGSRLLNALVVAKIAILGVLIVGGLAVAPGSAVSDRKST